MDGTMNRDVGMGVHMVVYAVVYMNGDVDMGVGVDVCVCGCECGC